MMAGRKASMLLQQQQAALLAASYAGDNYNMRISTREEVDAALANLPSDDDDANDFGDAGDEFSLTRKRTPRARAPPPSDRRRNTVSTKQPRGRAYFSQVAFV